MPSGDGCTAGRPDCSVATCISGGCDKYEGYKREVEPTLEEPFDFPHLETPNLNTLRDPQPRLRCKDI